MPTLRDFGEMGCQELAWNALAPSDLLWRQFEAEGAPPAAATEDVLKGIATAELKRIGNWRLRNEAPGSTESLPATIMVLAALRRDMLKGKPQGFKSFSLWYAELLDELSASWFKKAITDHQLKDVYHTRWAWDVIRGFSAPTTSVVIPVAFAGEFEGKIGRLHLELLNADPESSGRIVHHPRDRLSVVDGDAPERTAESDCFTTAIEHAFRLALERCDGSRLPPVEARWRVTDQADAPLKEIRGNSAGGAALWGWETLLDNLTAPTPRHADPRILVMGCLAEQGGGGLGPVGHMKRKIAALLVYNGDKKLRGSLPPIDTVVVCGEQINEVDCELKDQAAVRVLSWRDEIHGQATTISSPLNSNNLHP